MSYANERGNQAAGQYANVNAAPAPAPSIVTAVARTSSAGAFAREIRDRLSTLASQLDGGPPHGADSPTAKVAPAGVVGTLHDMNDLLGEALNDINVLVTRIERALG